MKRELQAKSLARAQVGRRHAGKHASKVGKDELIPCATLTLAEPVHMRQHLFAWCYQVQGRSITVWPLCACEAVRACLLQHKPPTYRHTRACPLCKPSANWLSA